MEFENFYDNFEREINFEEKIDINKLNSSELETNIKENKDNKNNNYSLRKRSSIIIPFGSASKIKKEEVSFRFNLYENDGEIYNNNYNNNFNNNNKYNNFNDNDDDDYFNQNLIKRKSSILGILESSINKKNSINNSLSVSVSVTASAAASASASNSNSNLLPNANFASLSSFVDNK